MDMGTQHAYITWGTTTRCLVELQRMFELRLTSMGWNPQLKVVLNHLDYSVSQNLTNAARRHLGLPVPWTPELAGVDALTPPVAWSNEPVTGAGEATVSPPVPGTAST